LGVYALACLVNQDDDRGALAGLAIKLHDNENAIIR
jgi:hypothetical protein